ncbi:type II secretion system protein [Oscillatoria amoena NRMC-F 0135]|nr:type II secretion system protein [Oscillatoria amoena NRMC-F 0135]
MKSTDSSRKLVKGLTLLELLVAIAIVAILSTMTFPVLNAVKVASSKVMAANTLNQLRLASEMYLTDNNGNYWPFRTNVAEGVKWWFGLEKTGGSNAEGQRSLDMSQGILGNYFGRTTTVKTDPAFAMHGKTLKPKFVEGAFGYGYNTLLFGRNRDAIGNPSKIVVFATSAQVNTFQAPASSKNPMIEEFYLLDRMNTTVHFRFGGKAMVAFADGRIDYLPMDKSTLDPRLPTANVARFSPRGTGAYLE